MQIKKSYILLWIGLFSVICLLCWWTARKNAQAIRTAALQTQNCTVIVDAGHGGMDGGATADDGTLEKDINLAIALKLNDLLQCGGIKTIMTRTKDISIHDPQAKTVRQQKISDIHNRLKIMESTEPAIFISIHQNHFSHQKYHGTQVFFSGNDARSAVLASSIQRSVTSFLQPENIRQIKQSGTEIYLLYHAVRPAVMVECGFLSNHEETIQLKNDDYQIRMALCIYSGILDFLNHTGEV